jgi:hypothetical protein
MAHPVNVLVTCSNRKTVSAPSHLKVRSLRKAPLKARAREWFQRLTGSTSGIVAADLYCGDHWAVARNLPLVAKKYGLDAKLWVCSAGLGLISSEAAVPAYSATFSLREPDSIYRQGDPETPEAASRTWWESAAEWSSLQRGAPRSLDSLSRHATGSPLIVAASPSYLGAILPDLERARKRLEDPRLLIIISAGTESLEGFEENLIPGDARFRALLGGALSSLNARIVERVLTDSTMWDLRADRLQVRFRRLLAKQPDLIKYERLPMSDAEVRIYIRKSLETNTAGTATRLLRSLRDDGRACEQKRFGALFRQVKEELYGSKV